MTMTARYCSHCGNAMHYMDYGPPEFRCHGLACPVCESRREEARAITAAKRKETKPEEYQPYEKCPKCQHCFISEHESQPPRHVELANLKKQLAEANVLLEKANESVTSPRWHADYHLYKIQHGQPPLFKLTEQEKREAEQEAAEKLLKALEELPEENAND